VTTPPAQAGSFYGSRTNPPRWTQARVQVGGTLALNVLRDGLPIPTAYAQLESCMDWMVQSLEGEYSLNAAERQEQTCAFIPDLKAGLSRAGGL
jgi:hypothetical protein